jgi:hypothetical protein
MIYHAFSYIHSYLQNLFFFVDVCHCFGLHETQAASADEIPNLHSKLGASQSFSRKITTRYLLKLIIPIIIYYYSTLRNRVRMTDSISPAGCPPITTLLALFYHFIIVRLSFGIVLVCRRPRQLPPMCVQIIIPNLTTVNSCLRESRAPAFR